MESASMSTENDVPLGEGSHRYYEQKFGDRIRQVNKRGGPARDPGGSNWNGRVSAGVIIGIIIVILRIMIAASRSGSHTSSYTYNPPQPPPFDAELQRRLNEIGIQGDQKDVFVPNGMPMFGKMPGAREDDPLLTDADVPLIEGLCYRIQQESLRPGQTPGGRIHQLLDEGVWKMLDQAARGQPLLEDEKEELLDALNDDALAQRDFTAGPSFNLVPGFATLRLMRDRPAGGVELWKYNRRVLEMCYPEQIVPLHERSLLDGPAREQWRKRARLDLEKARQEQPKR
jgi:hypothetical protein